MSVSACEPSVFGSSMIPFVVFAQAFCLVTAANQKKVVLKGGGAKSAFVRLRMNWEAQAEILEDYGNEQYGSPYCSFFIYLFSEKWNLRFKDR